MAEQLEIVLRDEGNGGIPDNAIGPPMPNGPSVVGPPKPDAPSGAGPAGKEKMWFDLLDEAAKRLAGSTGMGSLYKAIREFADNISFAGGIVKRFLADMGGPRISPPSSGGSAPSIPRTSGPPANPPRTGGLPGDPMAPVSLGMLEGPLPTVNTAGPPAAEAAAGGLARLGPVAASLAGVLGGVIAGVGIVVGGFALLAAATKAFVNVLAKEADKISGYSAEISFAQSMSSLRQELAFMRRADAVGPSLGKAEDLKGRFEEKMADAWTQVLRLLTRILETFEPLLNAGVNSMAVLADIVKLINESVDVILTGGMVKKEIEDVQKVMRDIAKKFLNLMENQDREVGPDFQDPFMTSLLNSI